MGKLIITTVNLKGKEVLFRGLHDGKRFYEIGFEHHDGSDEAEDIPGNIYVARVRDVVKNINAAFIEYRKGKKGYFSIDDNPMPVFLNQKNTDKICEGDLVLVQLQKEAVKTKAPVLTSHVSLTGKYVVLNVAKSGIGFSNKIKETEVKERISNALKPVLASIETEDGTGCGAVIRTNAKEAEPQRIREELLELYEKYKSIRQRAVYSSAFTVLHRQEKEYLKLLAGVYQGEIEEIVTDSREVFRHVNRYIEENQLERYQNHVRLYEDELQPLYKLYSVEKVCEQVLEDRVWLKSGAYLVLQQTEAMYVIDVNTGKCIKGKDIRKTIHEVNIEAAKEIAYQIRLRNISGIIMIDFINMDEKEDKEKLIEVITQCISRDRVKTDFVEMTKLELVALTRKKVYSPVHEQLKGYYSQQPARSGGGSSLQDD